MKQIIIIINIIIGFNLSAQNIHFIKSYGNNGYDFGRDIKQDIDTGYIATGSSSSFTSGNADAFLLKVDSLGNFKWSYNYGGNGTEWGESVVTTQNGAYAIGGYTNSMGAGGFDFYFVKTTNTGVPEIEKTYGGSDWDKAYDMVEMPDGGFVLVGETYSFGEGNNDIYIVRINDLGDTIWTRTYGGTEADYANAVLLDGDSLVVVGGTKSFGNGMTDGIILKYHIDGTLDWVKVAGKEREDYFTGIAIHDQTGEYSLSGTRDYNHFQDCDCGNDFWIYKIQPNGIAVIDTTRPGPDQLGTDIAIDVVIGRYNNTYFAGSTTSWGTPDVAQGFSDAYVGKFFTLYAPANSYIKNFGTTKSDVAYAIDNTYDFGKIIIGDMFHNSTGGYNMFILKIDEANTTVQITVTTELDNEIITLSLQEDQTSIPLNVYPTITQDFIKIDNLSSSNKIEIYNINGQKLFEEENSNGNIDMSQLASGLYLTTVIINQKSYAFKILKR